MKKFILALLLFPLSVFGAAVTDSGLTTSGDSSNTTSYVSASFTPAVGDLLVAFVSASGTVATGTMTDSASLGFTKVNSALFATSAGTLYCFVANHLVSSATGTTVTFDCTGDAATGAYIMVARVSGMSKIGLAAIRQSAKQENISSATAAAPVFSVSALTGNVTLGSLANSANPAAVTQPAGWTERSDGGFGTPTIGGEYVSKDNGFSSTTITWGSNVGGGSSGGALIVELDTTGSGFFQLIN